MSSNAIPDISLAASSFNPHSDWYREPKYARFGIDRFWSSAIGDLEPWIQVDLSNSQLVTRLQTQGNLGTKSRSYWVKQIKVQVGLVHDSLKFIEMESGEPKVCLIHLNQH